MTDLHRHIRFTVELSFEARTDTLAEGAALQGMLAHVAREKLSVMHPDDLAGQIMVVSDRPAHIAPFVRRRHHRLVKRQRRRSAFEGTPADGREHATQFHPPQARGKAVVEQMGAEDGQTSMTTDRSDLRRSGRRSSTTPRRRSA